MMVCVASAVLEVDLCVFSVRCLLLGVAVSVLADSSTAAGRFFEDFLLESLTLCAFCALGVSVDAMVVGCGSVQLLAVKV